MNQILVCSNNGIFFLYFLLLRFLQFQSIKSFYFPLRVCIRRSRSSVLFVLVLYIPYYSDKHFCFIFFINFLSSTSVRVCFVRFQTIHAHSTCFFYKNMIKNMILIFHINHGDGGTICEKNPLK